jgi:hypothetical protein
MSNRISPFHRRFGIRFYCETSGPILQTASAIRRLILLFDVAASKYKPTFRERARVVTGYSFPQTETQARYYSTRQTTLRLGIQVVLPLARHFTDTVIPFRYRCGTS